MTPSTAAALLLAGALTLGACNPDTNSKVEATTGRPGNDSAGANSASVSEVPVTIATVRSGALEQSIVATGTFGSRDEIPLSFKIGGVVSRVLVDQGTAVRRGQLLASLDLREIDAMVNKARVGVEKAERDAARIARLAADSVATVVQSQDANSALEASRADLASALVNRQYATISAPQDGVVLQRVVAAGTTIGAGMPVFMLGGSSRGRVLRAGVPDRDALRIRVGDAATVTFDALRGSRYPGTVSLLSQSADPRTGTYTVEVQLRDTPGKVAHDRTSATDAGSAPLRRVMSLPTGLVGRVVISTRATSAGSLIPVDALIEADADSATVYTVSDAAPFIAHAQRVRITQVIGNQVSVVGLAANARVAVRGAPYLTNGSRVRVIPESNSGTAVP